MRRAPKGRSAFSTHRGFAAQFEPRALLDDTCHSAMSYTVEPRKPGVMLGLHPANMKRMNQMYHNNARRESPAPRLMNARGRVRRRSPCPPDGADDADGVDARSHHGDSAAPASRRLRDGEAYELIYASFHTKHGNIAPGIYALLRRESRA